MSIFSALQVFINRFTPAYEGVTISNRVLVLDNLRLRNCRIENCDIFYGGGNLVLTGSTISACKFSLFGKAGAGLAFMKGLDEGGAQVVIAKTFERTFASSPDHYRDTDHAAGQEDHDNT